MRKSLAPWISFALIAMLALGAASSFAREVTITYSHGLDATGVTKKLIAQFMAKYPEIKVNEIELPSSTDTQHDSYVTKFNAGDDSVDVMAVDIIWPPEFGAAQWVLPLNKYFSRQELDEFLPGPVNGTAYNGKQYAIPWYTDAGVLYYRKDILDEAGVQPPKTWDELVKLSQQLKGKGDTEYGFVFQGNQYEGLICDFLEYVWGNGGNVLDGKKVVLNSPQNVEALQFMVDLVNKYNIVPPGVTTYLEEDSRRVFTEGKSVFMRNWPYAWKLANQEGSKVKGKVGIVPMPIGPRGKEPGATLGGWNLAINKYSRNVDAAVKFVKFWTSYDAQKFAAIEGARLPTRKAVYKDPDVLKVNPHFASFYDVFVTAKPRPVSPFYPMLSDAMQIQIHRAITGKISPQKALDNAAKTIEAIVKMGK